MQPDHIRRARGAGRDLVHIQIGCVGRQNSTGFAHGIKLAEHLFLDAHVLEHRFDHQIDRGEAVIVDRHLKRGVGHRIVFHLGDLATLERAGKIARDATACGLCGIFLHLDQHDVEACQQRRRGDACAHGATADDADGLQRPWLDAFQFRQVAYRTLREERVDHALTLVCLHQLHENLALGQHAFVKGQLCRGLNRADRLRRRDLPPPLFQRPVIGRIPVDRRGRGHLADGAARCVGGNQGLGIGDAHILGVALGDLIDDAKAFGFGRFDLTARGDQIKRRVHADQAG